MRMSWYLPSKAELGLMNAALLIINNILANDGNVASNPILPQDAPKFGKYWSSTEQSSSTAWAYSFRLWLFFSTNKSVAIFGVRAVRAF